MISAISPPPTVTAPLPQGGVGQAARAYAEALSHAGGSQLEALMRGTGHDTVCVGLYNSPAYDLHVPALPIARLSVHLTPAQAHGALDGERSQSFKAPRHSIYLTPAGTASAWRKDRPSRHLNIYFHHTALAADDTGDGPLDDHMAPVLNAALTRVLPGVAPLAHELASEFEKPGAFAAEATDCLARLLLVRLARLHASRARAEQQLPPTELARLKDYVRANLTGRVMVSDLAAVVGMSPQRFTRVYTRQTGLSPHTFVVDERLRAATSMLTRSRLPIAEVSLLAGFSSQQHLTSTMRKRLGVTPARYRAEVDSAGAEVPTP